MSAALEDTTLLLLNAAIDGELDAVGMIEIDARLAADARLSAEYARLVALHDAIQARVPRHSAPSALRARVILMARATGAGAPSASRRPRWIDAPSLSLAASLVLGIVLGAGAYGRFIALTANDDVQSAVVAGFIRGRLSRQPVDVVTSDRHTVKPWLAGKVAIATTVVDLAPDGFPLVGGRIDVVGGTPVPTLVYQRREHQIALSEMATSGDETSSAPTSQTRDGYSLLRWVDKSHLYEAVSDLPPTELDAFAVAFRRAAAAEREGDAKPDGAAR
jgi:anti-sigma factor RsiW